MFEIIKIQIVLGDIYNVIITIIAKYTGYVYIHVFHVCWNISSYTVKKEEKNIMWDMNEEYSSRCSIVKSVPVTRSLSRLTCHGCTVSLLVPSPTVSFNRERQWDQWSQSRPATLRWSWGLSGFLCDLPSNSCNALWCWTPRCKVAGTSQHACVCEMTLWQWDLSEGSKDDKDDSSGELVKVQSSWFCYEPEGNFLNTH